MIHSARNTVKIIDTHALTHNVKQLKTTASCAKLLAMVKANAYGHGIDTVVKSLVGIADGFGVAFFDEAMQVHACLNDLDKNDLQENVLTNSHLITAPIVIAEGVFDKKEWQTALTHGFDMVIHKPYQLSFALQSPPDNPKNTCIWVKYNTGMNRLGFDKTDTIDTCQKLADMGYQIVLMSHFACSDDKNHTMNHAQINKFNSVLQKCRAISPNIQASLCNSAGVIHFSDCHYNWVRTGIAMYGASPVINQTAQNLNLKPVMSLRSSIIAIDIVKQGQTVGYGATWHARQDTKIAIVAIGYGDGYPRTNQGFVLIHGQQCAIIGQVAMDMTAVDISHVDCQIGDSVTLWGYDSMGNILACEQVAKTANTISYELFCQVTNRPTLLTL